MRQLGHATAGSRSCALPFNFAASLLSCGAIGLMDECAPDISLAGDRQLMFTHQRRLGHASEKKGVGLSFLSCSRGDRSYSHWGGTTVEGVSVSHYRGVRTPKG
jgi:hypothetical protein